jgi:hypothetical protein
MFRLLIAALLLCLPTLARAQVSEAAAGLWQQSESRITFTAAHISFPLAAGSTRFTSTFEFSHQGEGLDTGLQFQSPDRQVFATAYVYYPGLPHAGLTAYATDQALRGQSANVRTVGTRVVGAGGHDGVAIRTDYAGYRENLASSAAFIKAGRWIVKLRVSGPEARRAEVEAAMAALLDAIHFEGQVQPRLAAPLEIDDCSAQAPGPSHLLPDDLVRNAATAIVGTFDGAGEEARDGTHGGTTILSARFGSGWCVSTRARIGQASYPILRARPPLGSGVADGVSLVAVPMNDAGTLLEAIRTRDHDHVILLYHEIGSSTLLGTYDAVPSDEQIANILSGADEPGTRIRAVIRLRPGQGANIEIPSATSTPAPNSK